MDETTQRKGCAGRQAQVEAYVDGDVDAAATAALAAHLAGCPACAQATGLARQVREGLQALPLLPCPESVMAGLAAQLRSARRERWRGWWAGWRRPLWQPLGAALVVATFVVFGVRLARQEPTPETGQPGAAAVAGARDVALAERQVKWALAYVSQVGERTGLTVRSAVDSAVVAPLRGGIHRPGAGGSL